MENDESKLRVTLEERIKSAMDRFFKSQAAANKAGRQRPLLRRKNNWTRGSLGIMCEHKGSDASTPALQSREVLLAGNRPVPHAENVHEFSKIKRAS